MKITIRYFRIVIILILQLIVFKATAETSVNIGILAFRPATEVQSRWQPLIKYLNDKLPGYTFYSHAYGYNQLEAVISQRKVDFVLTNPSHYILMTYRNGLSSPLTTLIPVKKGRYLSKFGGVIITLTDSKNINILNHIHGQTIAAVTKGSLGGYQAQAMELSKAGINIPKDVKLLETGMPHDLVVKAVIDGRANVGFIRTGVLEDMASEGKLDLSKIKIIAPKKVSNFPLLLSTELYPEWPFAAMPGVDDDLSRYVAAELLSITHGGQLAKQLNIHGFTIPSDYEIIRTTLELLRLPPFDSAPLFTLIDIWEKYWEEMLIGMLLITVIALLSIWLLFLNRQLAEGRQQIQRASHEWQRLLTAVGEGVYGVNGQGLCSFINPAALDMLGYSIEEILDQDQHILFHHHREDGTHYPAVECPISLTLNDGLARNVNDWFWRKDGSGFPVILTTSPMEENDSQKGTVVVFRDISKQLQIENQLRIEATTDPLTGIANRRFFIRQLNRELERFKRFGESAMVIMADIDYFKKINDTYGHAVGDEVLQHFTKLSNEYLRSTDLIGRLGGEEFAIMLPVTDLKEAQVFAERYRHLISETPAPTQEGNIKYTISLGLAEFNLSDDTPDNILARADSALYRAKENGRNTVEVCLLEEAAEILNVLDQSFIQLRWKAKYACRENSIDKEHKELFRLANILLDHVNQPEIPLKKIEIAFDTLLSYLEEHFTHEEDILRANGYTQLEEHIKTHKQLINHATKLRQQIGDEDKNVDDIVYFLVSKVVAGHMLHEDKNFFKLFRKDRI